MQTIYKVFLVLFIIFIGFSLYAVEWDLGFMHEENSKFLFSLAAGIIGLILVFVMDTWSRISSKKK